YCEGMQDTLRITDALECTGAFAVQIDPGYYGMPPTVTTTPACVGYDNGSVSLVFDPFGFPDGSTVDMIGPNGPVTSITTIGQTVEAGDLVAGDYSFTVLANDPMLCAYMGSFTVPAITIDCGEVNGTAFIDLNADCVQDPGDPALPLRPIVIQ